MEGLPPSRRRRRSPAVAWVLLLAVLVGLAAALLSRPVVSSGPGPPSFGGLTTNQVGEILAITLLGGFGIWLFLTLRDTSARLPFPPQIVATMLLVIILGVLFVELAGVVHYARPTPGNGTAGSPPANVTGNNVTTNGTSPRLVPPRVTLPGWAGAAALLGLAVLAGVLLVPYLVARAEYRRRARSESDAEPPLQARRALEETLARLRSGEGADPRAAILALYSRLLQIVGPRLGTIESRTPREIERDSIRRLGLGLGVAQDLTDAFEEARYSSHPMTPEAVDRARAALTEAVSDLAKGAGVQL
ncbi:MAG: DUF4129 domain-containing protein [Thermoplasmata archaeon]|nr:DUF4129 domain-containing protein [Thermoplasmata archaeon]